MMANEDFMTQHLNESAYTAAPVSAANLGTEQIAAMVDSIRAKQREAPKTEIWITEAVPQFDDDGEWVIIKINVHEFGKSLWSPKLNMIPAATIATMTGADEVIMLHPLAYAELGEVAPRGVPVFTDSQRHKKLAID